jgi:hypothetical protein
MVSRKLIGACMPRHRHPEWLKFLSVQALVQTIET